MIHEPNWDRSAPQQTCTSVVPVTGHTMGSASKTWIATLMPNETISYQMMIGPVLLMTSLPLISKKERTEFSKL